MATTPLMGTVVVTEALYVPPLMVTAPLTGEPKVPPVTVALPEVTLRDAAFPEKLPLLMVAVPPVISMVFPVVLGVVVSPEVVVEAKVMPEISRVPALLCARVPPAVADTVPPPRTSLVPLLTKAAAVPV